MDNKHIILSDPVQKHVGKNIFEVGQEVLNTQELAELNAFLKKLDSDSSGTAVLFFPTKDEKPKKEIKLFAFVHFHGQNGIDSIVVTERLSALTGPLQRNSRDILLLAGLFIFLILSFGYIFYCVQKKRIETETTSRALEIINRQLHCQIDDYRCIEKNLKSHRR